MVFLASHGYRCIAHDRRGHGRSSQLWSGNEMDTYADDLAELFEALDLKGEAGCSGFHGINRQDRFSSQVKVFSIFPQCGRPGLKRRRKSQRFGQEWRKPSSRG